MAWHVLFATSLLLVLATLTGLGEGTTYLELPTVKAPRPACKQRYREWSEVVVAAVQPNARELAKALQNPNAFEVLMGIATEGNAAGSKGAVLRGPTHFTVFHTLKLSHMAIANKLVQMANGEVVMLVLPGDEASTTAASIAKAAVHFAQRPALGMLSFSHGYDGSGTVVAGNGSFQYVAAAAFGPLAVRRKALLELGGFSLEECAAGGAECGANSALELSARMWGAGYSVGIADDVRAGAIPCADIKAYQSALSDAWAQAACTSPAAPPVEASLIIQYFKRKANIKAIVKGIKATVKNVEVLINDDSQTDYADWASMLGDGYLTGGGYLVYSPNIHEIRGYNRLAKLASGKLLVFMQDDDAPKAPGWLKTAQTLLKQHSWMQLLGGLRGRMDYGTMMDPKYNYINGPKYGPPSDARSCCDKIPTVDPTTGAEFMFVYKVNLGPMLTPRSSFLASGMYHTALSCAGDPGIGFDFEYSIRMWYLGYSVGLYNSGFSLDIGNHDNSGTRTNSRIYNVRRENELRNNKLMYKMYKGFHHSKGNKRAAEMWDKLKKGKSYKRPTDASATARFISEVLRYRGKSSGGGVEGATVAARKQGVLSAVRRKVGTGGGSSWHPRSASRASSPATAHRPAPRVLSRTRLPSSKQRR